MNKKHLDPFFLYSYLNYCLAILLFFFKGVQGKYASVSQIETECYFKTVEMIAW